MAVTTGGGAGGRAESVVFAVSFNRETKTTSSFELAGLEKERADPRLMSWIDIQSPDIDALNDVLRRLGIDLVLASHFEDEEILPRIVERSDCLAFYLYEVEDPELHLDTSGGLRDIDVVRMILVFGADFVVTYHRGDVEAVHEIREACAESFRLWAKTQGFIAFLFLQRSLYDFAHLNLASDNFLDHLEARVMNGDPHHLAADISVASRNILTLKKLVASLHIVLMRLAIKRSRFVSEEARQFYHEMLFNAVAVRDSIDSSRDLLDGIVRSIQARASQRTGDIARVLTVVSAIVLPLSLVAGIYGMNFRYMPELGWRWAYFGVLAAMAVLGLSLLAVFWRLGWLERGGGGRRGQLPRDRTDEPR